MSGVVLRAEVGGCLAIIIAEEFNKRAVVVKARAFGDFFNGKVGINEQAFNKTIALAVDIFF